MAARFPPPRMALDLTPMQADAIIRVCRQSTVAARDAAVRETPTRIRKSLARKGLIVLSRTSRWVVTPVGEYEGCRYRRAIPSRRGSRTERTP